MNYPAKISAIPAWFACAVCLATSDSCSCRLRPCLFSRIVSNLKMPRRFWTVAAERTAARDSHAEGRRRWAKAAPACWGRASSSNFLAGPPSTGRPAVGKGHPRAAGGHGTQHRRGPSSGMAPSRAWHPVLAWRATWHLAAPGVDDANYRRCATGIVTSRGGGRAGALNSISSAIAEMQLRESDANRIRRRARPVGLRWPGRTRPRGQPFVGQAGQL